MNKKKVLYSIVSALVVSSMILTGCSKSAEVPVNAKAPVVNTAKEGSPAGESAKAVKPAVEAYFTNIGSTVKDSYTIPEKDLGVELGKNPVNYAVLDIRKADVYQLGHIKGAVNAPYGPSIASNLDKIRAFAKDKTLVIVCDNGQMAAQVTSLLNIAGIKTRASNHGMGTGLDVVGWASLKLPLDTNPTLMPALPAVASPNKAIDDAVIKNLSEVPIDSYIINLPVLKEALAKNADKYYFIDIRKAEDFAKGHIKGFVNIPYGPDITKNLDSIKEKGQGKTVVVSCYTGQKSGQVAAAFNILGISTKSVDFGFGKDGFPKGWSTDKANEIVK